VRKLRTNYTPVGVDIIVGVKTVTVDVSVVGGGGGVGAKRIHSTGHY